ncbi:MAG: hypothetical protein EBQ96_03965 [Proteobacteria bacterium]|nr:hypothetical protein [Pseudomonadota bacterium]
MTTSTTPFASKAAPRKFRMDDTDTIVMDGQTLTRIIANVDIPGVVKAGEKGGYIQHFSNLSYNGSCWVHEGAFVIGETAHIGNDAQIRAGVTVVACNVTADADIHGPRTVTLNEPELPRVLDYMARRDAAAAAARLRAA